MKAILFLTLMVSLLIFGCGSDSKNPVTPKQTTPPELPQVVAPELPANAPSNVKMMTGATGDLYSGRFSIFNQFQGRKGVWQDSSWTWSDTFDSITVTIKSQVKDDGSTEWQMILNGSDNGVVYDNWVVMEGQVSADKNSGYWIFYEERSQTPASTWSWQIDGTGNRTTTVQVETTKIVYVNNTDGSGSVGIYESEKLFFEAEWKADRTGWWKVYDDNGTLLRQGTWG